MHSVKLIKTICSESVMKEAAVMSVCHIVCLCVYLHVCVCPCDDCWQSVSALIIHALWHSGCDSGSDPDPAGTNGSTLDDLMLMPRTCMCVCVCVWASICLCLQMPLHIPNLIKAQSITSCVLTVSSCLALLPADCRCSLQADLTSQTPRLLVLHMRSPQVPLRSWLSASWQAHVSMQVFILSADREGSQTMLKWFSLLPRNGY